MSEYIPEGIKNENYIELTTNIDNAQFTIISVTGLIDQNTIESQKKTSHMHYHDCYEVFCIEDGSLKLKLENEIKTYVQNDFIVISPYVNHTLIENNVTNKLKERILFLTKKNNLKNAYHIYEKLTSALDAPIINFKVNHELCEIFKSLKDSITSKDKLMASLYFHKIITVIIKMTNSIDENTQGSFMPDSTSSRSHKIHMMINQYYTSDITLEYIAQNLNLSTRQVSRFIKQQYGCTYRELINQMRMKTAMELLITTTRTITEIAMEVGFKSTKGFYKAFKTYYESLPTKFRKKNG